MLNKRTLVRQSTKDLLDAWLAENPGIVQQIDVVRPAHFQAVPQVYIGAIRFSHESTVGLLSSTGEVEVVVVGPAIDNAEGVTMVEGIADSLVSYFSANPHFVHPNTVAEPTQSENTDLSVGDAAFHGCTVTIGNVLVVEGRES